jgi:Tfp pilus tip-associated adhesin PilY1
MRQFVIVTILATGAITLALTAGCESEAQNSALLGSAIGAGVGALAGGDTEGTLIGAAIGGGVGYGVGNEAERKQTQQEMAAIRAEQNNVTVWITNSNGSTQPVQLRRSGPGYIGPNGEYYTKMPTNEQLAHYGF